MVVAHRAQDYQISAPEKIGSMTDTADRGAAPAARRRRARPRQPGLAALAAELRERLAEVRRGGGERARTRHVERGKLLVRDRSTACSTRARRSSSSRRWPPTSSTTTTCPAAGIVTGIGRVEGVKCMIVANDATVKGGTYYPVTVKKHLRAQQIALENRLPCIYLVDSGGAFLPLQDEVFPDRDHFGRIFFNQAQLSAAGIPQLVGGHGVVHGGRRVRPGDVGRDRDRRATRARSSSAARRS